MVVVEVVIVFERVVEGKDFEQVEEVGAEVEEVEVVAENTCP